MEELTAIDLSSAPDFSVLMKSSHVLHWNEAGFWNKLRFYLPDPKAAPAAARNKAAAASGPAGLLQSSALGGNANYGSSGWHYDSVLSNNLGSVHLPSVSRHISP